MAVDGGDGAALAVVRVGEDVGLAAGRSAVPTAGGAATTLGGGAEPTVDEASALLRRAGGSTLSWMTTWDGNDYFRTSTGIVAFQKRVGAVIALAAQPIRVIAVLGAHCDDIAIGLGGTLLQLAEANPGLRVRVLPDIRPVREQAPQRLVIDRSRHSRSPNEKAARRRLWRGGW